MTESKKCCDCWHYMPSEYVDLDKCTNPMFALKVSDLVRGGERNLNRYCECLRTAGMECGVTAVGFEAKEVQP